MTISSMTGFGRGEGALNAHAWVWEVRSVNARGLDVRCRLPNGFEGLEPAVRQRFAAHLNRGSVTASLNLTHTASGGQVRINEDVLEQYLAAASALRQRLPDSPPPAIEGVLALRGVVETGDNVVCGEARAELDAALLLSLDPVIDALVQQRRTEGGRLAAILGEHLARIDALCQQATALAATQPAAIQVRLETQLSLLIAGQPALPAERLAQEVALLATRADVREELDRLRAHHQQALGLVADAAPVGRRLDFLCQEFNREANTLCSKSADIDLTRVGLDLKSVIDQLREQVQNVE
ncbi:MAG: YicC/YloC family endoribonuclease [Rhodospirillales bacterium]